MEKIKLKAIQDITIVVKKGYNVEMSLEDYKNFKFKNMVEVQEKVEEIQTNVEEIQENIEYVQADVEDVQENKKSKKVKKEADKDGN